MVCHGENILDNESVKDCVPLNGGHGRVLEMFFLILAARLVKVTENEVNLGQSVQDYQIYVASKM
jgi:hypothetical protein